MATQIADRHSLGPQEVRLLDRILRSERAVLRVRRDHDIIRGFAPNSLRLLLHSLARGGWLVRIEKGVYAVTKVRGVQTHQQLALVADWLDGEDYVVTGFFALAHWNLTGDPPSTIDVLLARRRSNVKHGRTFFRFVFVPADRLPDHKQVSVPGARALARIVTPEGAVAHVLAGRHATNVQTAVEAVRRGLGYRILQRRRLVQAVRLAPRTAARRLGWIAQHEGDHVLADALRTLVGNGGYVALDPKLGTTGARRNQTWRVLENVEIDD